VMLTRRSTEHCEPVHCDGHYIQARNDECRRRGLVVCVCAQPPVSGADMPQCGHEDVDYSCGHKDKRGRQSMITRHDSDDGLSCQPRDHCGPASLLYSQSHDTSRHPFIAAADDVHGSSGRHVDDDEFKSQLMVDYDVHYQQSSTRTCTEDTSLDSVGSSLAHCTCSSDEWYADRGQHSQRRRRTEQHDEVESGSPRKKRLTLSCVLADFSALLRRVSHLRVSRTARDHETRV